MAEVAAGRWMVWIVWLIVPGERFGVLDSVHVEQSSALLRGAVLLGLHVRYRIDPQEIVSPAVNLA